MTRILKMILGRLVKTGKKTAAGTRQTMTPQQKAAQRRVRKVMKMTQRMHRI